MLRISLLPLSSVSARSRYIQRVSFRSFTSVTLTSRFTKHSQYEHLPTLLRNFQQRTAVSVDANHRSNGFRFRGLEVRGILDVWLRLPVEHANSDPLHQLVHKAIVSLAPSPVSNVEFQSIVSRGYASSTKIATKFALVQRILLDLGNLHSACLARLARGLTTEVPQARATLRVLPQWQAAALRAMLAWAESDAKLTQALGKQSNTVSLLAAARDEARRVIASYQSAGIPLKLVPDLVRVTADLLQRSDMKNDAVELFSQISEPEPVPEPPKPLKVSLTKLYQRQVASGKLEYDEHQFAILKQLDDIDYNAPVSVSTPAKSAQNPTSSSTDPLVIRSTHIESAPTRSSPRGAYLWGDVGTGKSMLMDLLFNNAPVQRKRRVHFHSFMLEVQARIHERNQTLLADKAETIKDRDAVGFVGQELSQQCRLLCFDEMQLTDICDAFLISKILTILWTNGVILVATSNRPPLELYKDGLNRAFFVPFLRRIEKECAVHSLQSGRDYRQTATPLPDAYFTPDNADTRALLWSKFTAGGQQVQRDVVIPLPHGRTLTVPFSCNRTCFISFRELCELERGAADYRGLANAFSCVYLYGVPLMSVLRHDFARRFITLIDELYDAGTRLCWTSAAPPVDLFRTVEAAEVEFRQVELGGAAFGTDHTWADRSDSAPHTTRDPVAPVPPAAAAPVEVAPVKSSPSFATHGAIDAAQEELKLLEGELASVQELRFAFKRAASRLTEMSGAEYVERWTTRRTKSVEL